MQSQQYFYFRPKKYYATFLNYKFQKKKQSSAVSHSSSENKLELEYISSMASAYTSKTRK